MMNTVTIKPIAKFNEQLPMDNQGDLVLSPYFGHGGRDDKLSSQEVVDKIRGELRYLDDQIRGHRYLQLLNKRMVDLPTLRAFPGHQYHIINSDLRSIAMMVHRFSEPLVQSYFKQVFDGEGKALKNLRPLAQKLGMSETELEHYPITHEGFAYAAYMSWLSMYGTPAEIVAGFLVNFSAWGFNCGQMSQSLKKHYGFAEADTVFLDAFANLPSFTNVALQIIQDGLNEGVEPWRIQRAAYLFQRYEIMFWDSMANSVTL